MTLERMDAQYKKIKFHMQRIYLHFKNETRIGPKSLSLPFLSLWPIDVLFIIISRVIASLKVLSVNLFHEMKWLGNFIASCLGGNTLQSFICFNHLEIYNMDEKFAEFVL